MATTPPSKPLPRMLTKFGRLILESTKEHFVELPDTHPARTNHPVSNATASFLLFAADTPNSWKVAAVLEEIQVPYDVILVDLAKDEQKMEQYIDMNPNGRTPTLHDRDLDVFVFESGAICCHLCDKFNKNTLLPSVKNAAERSNVMGWLMWQMSGLGPMMGQCMYFKRIAAPISGESVEEIEGKLKFGIDRFEQECIRLLGVLEKQLDGHSYICHGISGDEFTLADIACYGYVCMYWWAGLKDKYERDFPNVMMWLKRLEHSHPCIMASLLVPGVSNASPTAPTFGEMKVDVDLQTRIEQSAIADNRGRYFGWKDLGLLFQGSNSDVAFASHVPSTK